MPRNDKNDRRFMGLRSKHVKCSKHDYQPLGPTRSRPKQGLRQGMTSQPARMSHDVHESKVVCSSCSRITWIPTSELPGSKQKQADDKTREQMLQSIEDYLTETSAPIALVSGKEVK